MIPAVTQSWFTPIGSRSIKPSNTIHAIRRVDFFDRSRGEPHGTAFCGAQVRYIGPFPEATVNSSLCERCRRSGRANGFVPVLSDCATKQEGEGKVNEHLATYLKGVYSE